MGGSFSPDSQPAPVRAAAYKCSNERCKKMWRPVMSVMEEPRECPWCEAPGVPWTGDGV